MNARGKSKVILRGATYETVAPAVRECMELCDWQGWVGRDATVVLKPNLCTAVKEIIPSANTELAVTRAVCEVLLSRTRKVIVCEADHMRQTTPEVYEATGYADLKHLGVELANLSHASTTPCECPPVGEIELPRLLLEADVFITIPTLKTHALTYFTGSLKNQWGCVPHYKDRIRFHGFITEMLSSLHRLLRPQMSLMDGILAMEGRGPTAGQPRELNVILASRDSVALDATCMRLVGLNPERSRHVVYAAKQGLGRFAASDIEVDGDWEKHATWFKPAPRDWANTAMFYMGRYPWFVRHILGNDTVYYPVSKVVKFLRRTGVLGG